jgi:hypothetical protein
MTEDQRFVWLETSGKPTLIEPEAGYHPDYVTLKYIGTKGCISQSFALHTTSKQFCPVGTVLQ